VGNETIIIELSGPPIGKGRPRFSTRGGFTRVYSPPATVAYEGQLKRIALHVIGKRRALEGALAVTVLAVFPLRDSWPKWKRREAMAQRLRPTTKPDSDNILKVLDALNNIVFLDDAQIVDARIVKFYGARPRLIIEVTPLAPSIERAAITETQDALPLGAEGAVT